MPIIFLLVILVTAVIGLVSSWYLYHHRQHGKTVECVINVECDSIISSRHNRLYGRPNDEIGLAYFGLTLILAIIGIITAAALWASVLLLLSALLAGAYAGYLMYIQ